MLIDTALIYLTKHKLVPLPCMGEGDSKGKIPLVKWEKIQALPTEEQIKNVFLRFPDANIGFKTGKVSGILVLDNDGVQITDPMPLTPTATSRPGHFHSYFKNPSFYVPPSASKIGEHLDIRCDQAFIVAPPSKHYDKTTGTEDGQYEWVDGMSPDDIPFANPPDWLITKIKRTLSTTHGFDWSTALNIGIGARDETLKSAAASLIAKGFEYNIALSILRGINNTYNPPLPDELVINKLETAIEYIRTKKEDKEVNFGILSGNQLLDKEFEEQDWMIDRIISVGGITIIVGESGSGKSYLALAIIKSLVKKEALFEQFEIRTQPNILVIDKENGLRRTKKRMQSLGVPFAENIYFMEYPERFSLDSKEGLEYITAFIKTENINLIIIDSLIDIILGSENSSVDISTVFNTLRAIAPDSSYILLHHDSKPIPKFERTASQKTRGSSNILAQVDNQFYLDKQRDNKLHIEQGKSRDLEPLKKFEVEFTSNEAGEMVGFKYIGEVQSELSKIEQAADFIMTYLAFNADSPRQTIIDAGDGQGISQSATERALTMLKERKLVNSKSDPLKKNRKLYFCLSPENEENEEKFE